MSHEATNWAVKRKGLRPIAKVVLWHLSDCHNPTMGCFPTQEYLAEQAEISRSSVNRVLDELEAAGLIRREPQVDPETKRQRPTRYRLAFEDGFEPLDVGSRVPALDLAEVADPCPTGEPSRVPNSAEAVSHSSDTPITSKGTGKLTSNSPQPPFGGLDFASLWKAWPTEHQGNRDNAEGAWGKLGLEARASALRQVPVALKAFVARGDRVPALVMYLRNRVFEDFEGGPELDADGHFVVKPGSAEWNEWLGWIRATYGQGAVDRTVQRGSFLPKTRWPPKVAA